VSVVAAEDVERHRLADGRRDCGQRAQSIHASTRQAPSGGRPGKVLPVR
jgi:hypothetical protein